MLKVHPLPVPIAGPDTTVCEESAVQLRASDGNLFVWNPVPTLQHLYTANPTATPIVTTGYKVKVTNQFGCIWYELLKQIKK